MTAAAKRPHRRVSDVELDRARELLADGVSIRETARTLDRAPMTIWRHFRGQSQWDRRVEAQMRTLRREFGL
jgi:hypothetical protein